MHYRSHRTVLPEHNARYENGDTLTLGDGTEWEYFEASGWVPVAVRPVTNPVTGGIEFSSGGMSVPSGIHYSQSSTALSIVDDIASPLEIANCELWLDASNGPITNAGADVADGAAVTTWLDNSGNARHATVAAGTPTMSATGGCGGKPGVQIGASCRMVTPAFVTNAYGNAITAFVVSKEAPALHSSLKLKFSISTASFWVGNVGTTGARDITINGLTGFTKTGSAVPELGGIDYVSVSASAVRLSTDGFGPVAGGSANSDSVSISAGAVPFTNGAVTIGGLAGSATYDWPGTISEVILFSRALTTAEIRRIYTYLANKYGRRTLSLLGNSLLSGTGSTGGATQVQSVSGTNIPSRLMASAVAPIFRIRSDAYPGRTGTQLYTETPDFSGVFGDGNGAVTLVWEGTNTLATTGSVVKAFDDIRRVCLLRHRPGRKVIVGTVLPRGDSGNDAKNAALTEKLNSMIRSRYSEFADAVCDFSADSRLSNFNDETYFDSDKVHLKNAGYQVCADILEPLILSL